VGFGVFQGGLESTVRREWGAHTDAQTPPPEKGGGGGARREWGRVGMWLVWGTGLGGGVETKGVGVGSNKGSLEASTLDASIKIISRNL